MSDKTVHLVAHIHPFAPSDRITREIAPGQTVEQIVAGLGIKLGNQVAYINGNRIIREAWCYRKAFEGDHVVVKVVPAGGQGSDTSNALHKGAGIATLAGFGLFVAGFFTAGATWGIGLGLAGAGLLVGLGTTAVDNTMAALKAAGLSQESILSIRGGSNQTPTLGTKIPVILGKHLITPYYAARPYTNIATVATPGDTQYLRMLFCLGVGPLRISQIKIGENLLASNSAGVRNGAITVDGIYTKVELQIYQNGTSPSLYPYTTIEEQPGIELKSGVEHWLTTAKKTDRVHVDITLPSGLYQYNDSGEKLNHSVTIEVRRRAVGSGTAWASCTLVGTFALTQARAKTMRFDLAANLTAGQYEVGMKRITADDADGFKGASMVQWSAFRSQRRAEPPVDAEIRSKYVFLAVYIKATAQLSGVISQLNCIAESEIPVWDGATSGASGWATAGFSQNPAALYLWALRGPMNPRPVPDAAIDWPRLETLYASCAAKGWTCNAVLASEVKLRAALARIASTARSTPTIRDGLYSVVADEPKTDIAQHFTPRNVRNFSWSKAFSDLPYGLLANFVSADDGYDDNQRIVPYDGYTEAEAEAKLESIDLWGITNPTLVYKHGRYRLAVAKLRPEVMTFETDAEGIVCEPGDLVVLSHDAIVVGHASGRVKYVQVDVSGNAVAVTVDELVTMADGGTYGIRFRRASGESVYTAVTTVVGETNEIEFAVSIAAAHVPAPGDLFTFGVAGIETARCIVAGIEPMDDLACRIYLVDEAPGVHTADSGDIPEFNSRVSPPASAAIVDVVDTVDEGSTEDPFVDAVADAISRASISLRLSAPSISRSRAGVLAPAAVTASGLNADGTAYAGRLVIALSHDGGATWTTVYTSSADESSHEYTVPATIEIEAVMYYVSAVRASLYAAGGTTTLLREATVPVALDSSSSAIYWGSFNNTGDWPVASRQFGDYLWDNRASGSSGGVIRYWDGAAWTMATIAWPGYTTAIKIAIDDIAAWVNTYGGSVGEVTAFMNAIIGNAIIKNGIIDFLATSIQVSTALCLDGVTRISQIDWDEGVMIIRNPDQSLKATLDEAALTTEQVIDETRTQFARIEGKALKIGDINPSTLEETVVASIERDDFSDEQAVILGKLTVPLLTGTASTKTLPTSMARLTSQLYNGKIYMPQSSGTTLEVYDIASGTTTVKTLPTSIYRGTSQLYNGKIYMPQNSGTTLEIYDIASGTTTVKTLPTNMARLTSQLYNGKLYMPQNRGTTLEIYDIATDTTTVKALPTSMYRGTSQLYNGKIYIPDGSGTTLEVYDIASGTTEVKTLPTSMYRSTSQLYNGKLYMPRDSGTTLEVYDIASGTTEVKTLPTSMSRYTSQLYNGKIYMPQNSGTTLEVYDIASGTTEVKTLPTSMSRYTSQLYNGKIYMPQNSGTTLEIYEIETRAQVGAGIIESGYVSGRGWYVKYGDGTMECTTIHVAATLSAYGAVYRKYKMIFDLPVAFTSINAIIPSQYIEASSYDSYGFWYVSYITDMDTINLNVYSDIAAPGDHQITVKGRWKA